MRRRPVAALGADLRPEIRARVVAALDALRGLPSDVGFVLVVTDEDHHYYSDQTAESAAGVLSDVIDGLVPTTELEN